MDKSKSDHLLDEHQVGSSKDPILVDNPSLLVEYNAIPLERRIEIEKKLKRKLDLRLFPVLLVFYLLNYIDRNALPAAKLAGIQTDLGLSSKQYATVLSILYVGYLGAQVPSNLILTTVRPSLYLPIWMAIWGVVSGSTASVHSYGGLFAVRFCLGFAEAPFFPGALYLLSSWYTSKELALRTSILYGGSLLSGSFGSLIALGITSTMDGVRGLESWRWLFLIEGAITVGVAILSIPILPDYPSTTRWLSHEEKIVARGRLMVDTAGKEDTNESLLVGAKKMILEPKVWILMINHFCITLCASFTNFFPTVMGTLGFKQAVTYALLSPPYLTAFFVTVVACHHADKTRERRWHMVAGLLVTIVGLIILGSSLNTAARIVATILMPSGVYVAFDCNLAWISNSIPRTKAKRSASIAFINALSNTGNIAGSYLFPDSAKPRYTMAVSVEAGAAVISIFLTLAFAQYLKMQNRKLDRLEETGQQPPEDIAPGFRYIY